MRASHGTSHAAGGLQEGSPANLRQFVQIVLRYKVVIAVAALLGFAAGTGYTLVRPPAYTSKALVILPTNQTSIQTQVVIAGSTPVLVQAAADLRPPASPAALHDQVLATSVTPNVLSISARATTPASAEDIAQAVAASYLAYVRAPGDAGGPITGRLLGPASAGTGDAARTRVLTALLGIIAGALAGLLLALGLARADRRLRSQDELADAAGVPVLASIPVLKPSGAAGWQHLFASYAPDVVHAWALRVALRRLGLTDAAGREADGASLTVFSLASDRRALAVGPQLATFAASLGIRTALVVSNHSAASAPAAVRAACAAIASAAPSPAANLTVRAVDGGDDDGQPAPALTIVVAVLDETAPAAATTRTATAVLAVSAGAATSEQLARAAVGVTADGRDLSGIVVADPDPADVRVGHPAQPAAGRGRREPAAVVPMRTASGR